MFLIAMSYIRKYLHLLDRVLEVGVGAGLYAHAIAREGYQVDLLEPLESNMEAFMDGMQSCEDAYVVQSDPRNLVAPDDTYNLVLLSNVMGYMHTYEDQRLAIEEAVRVTKPGGYLYVCYSQDRRMSIAGEAVFKESALEDLSFQEDPGVAPKELYTLESIDAMMVGLPVQRLHLAGLDIFASRIHNEESGLVFDDYRRWFNWVLPICEGTNTVRSASQLLAVYHKNA